MSTQTDLLITTASWPNSLNVLLTVVILHGIVNPRNIIIIQHEVDVHTVYNILSEGSCTTIPAMFEKVKKHYVRIYDK